MKVGIRLLGTASGRADVEHFKLESTDGKGLDDQQAVFEHFQTHCHVATTLRFGLQGGTGMITLRAANSDLRSDVVAAIRQHAQNAIDSIN